MVRHFEKIQSVTSFFYDSPQFPPNVSETFETDPQTAHCSLLLPPGNKVTKPLPFLQNETSSFVPTCFSEASHCRQRLLTDSTRVLEREDALQLPR